MNRDHDISEIRTLRLGEFPNILFVEVVTREGRVGLGETAIGPRAVEAYIHAEAAPRLLGKSALDIERHSLALQPTLGYDGSGAETRGNSAVDIALWDLLGQVADQPLYQVLGGRARDQIRVYNTCAGDGDSAVGSAVSMVLKEDRPKGPYDDQAAFLSDAGQLAESLLNQGITAMKIWPFDGAATRTKGLYIDDSELDAALTPFRKIRNAVGSEMDIMVELHALWRSGPARRIIEALEEFEPFWVEDPTTPDSPETLAMLTSATDIPVAIGETIAGRQQFKRLLDARAMDVLILDIGWCGGITEARKVAALADTEGLKVALHDCTGPVVLASSVHLSLHLPNALIQEHVRAFCGGWYRDLVTELPQLSAGHMTPPAGAGLGTRLLSSVWHRPDASIRTSTLR